MIAARRLPALVALLFTCLVPFAAADLGGFTIERFDVEIEILADASVVVRERIVVNFAEPRRGIYRTIPVRYTDPRGFQYGLGFKLLDVTDDAGNEYGTKLTNQGSNRNIRIGRADVFNSGEIVYNIRYKLTNALRQFETHDELYWNVTGNQWATSIATASATIRLPAAIDEAELKRFGFTGRYGSTRADLEWTTLDAERAHVETTGTLGPYEGLTFALGWPRGHVDFPGPVARTASFIFRNAIVMAPLLAFFWLLRRWRRIGRDPAGVESVVVRYEPPDDLRPGEIGTVVDERVNLRDLTATIVDLAVRGHLRIEVNEEKHLFGLVSVENIVFHRTNRDRGGELHGYEELIVNGIFYDGGDRTEAKDLAQRFYKTIPKVKKSLYQRLVANGYFKADPTKVIGAYVAYGFLAGIAVAGAGVALGVAMGAVFPSAAILPVVSAVVTAIVFFGFASAMPCRTKSGVHARGWALGFEEFIDRVESHKLEDDRRRNVFEALLPYAMALGVAEKWANEFEGIYTTGNTPGWYVGTHPLHAGITTASFNRALQSSLTQASQSMAASPRSSGSSGSGGGGFSGGGGGGGGGGSW